MRALRARRPRNDDGASAVEYGIMLTVIVLVVIGIIGVFGGLVSQLYADVF